MDSQYFFLLEIYLFCMPNTVVYSKETGPSSCVINVTYLCFVTEQLSRSPDCLESSDSFDIVLPLVVLTHISVKKRGTQSGFSPLFLQWMHPLTSLTKQFFQHILLHLSVVSRLNLSPICPADSHGVMHSSRHPSLHFVWS